MRIPMSESDPWLAELRADEEEDRVRKDYIRERGSLFERLYLWVTGEEPECFSRHLRLKFNGEKGEEYDRRMKLIKRVRDFDGSQEEFQLFLQGLAKEICK